MADALWKRLQLLLSVLTVLLLIVAVAGAWGWWWMRGSLPRLDGTRKLAGLSAAVKVERDALGVPAITGATREDVARATGFVHAQDRFFQMDLLRRSGADHVTEHGLPVGTAVEAVSVAALRRAAQLTDAPYDREHVTPYLRRGPGMRAVVLRAPTMLTNPRLRLTVDTADDLALVRRIYARLGARTSPAPLTDIMTIAEQLSADQLQQTGAVAR